MRIPSGKTDQSIYFVAVDATDLVTREAGLSSFTVYRSRNGAAEVAYTTPTITEIDATNMPGVYTLLVDEDTTIGSSSDSEEYCVHITHSGMAPITRTIELYRRDTTTGRTLAVDSNSRVDVGAVLGTAQTAGDLAALITAVDNFVDTEVATIITNIATLQTSVNTIDDFIDTEVAAIFNRIGAPVGASISADIAAVKSETASIVTKVDTIDDFVDTEVAAIKAKTDNLPSDPADASDIAGAFSTVNTTLSTIAGYIDTEIAAIKAKTDNLPASPAATGDIVSAAVIADAVWDEAIAGHAGAGSTGEALADAGTGGMSASDIRDAVGLASANLDTQLGAIDDYLDTEVAAIKAKTDNLPASPAASGDIPSANANADALLDRANGIETGYTPRQALRIMSAVLGGKSSGHPGSPVYRNLPDSADRVAATVSSGNRSAVTLTP